MTWTITEQGITWEISESLALSGLTDVVISSPSNGQSLIYNTAQGKWINSTGSGSGDVVGPSSSTDGLPAIFDGATGKLLKALTAAQIRTNLSLVPGTDVQAYDADLLAFAGLTSAADKLGYFTGSGTMSTADFTALARNLVALAGPSAVRFFKVNADNTVSLRTAAEMLSDIGAQAAGTYLVAANNLSDLVSAATARTNLGGTTAGQNIFTVTNPGAITFLRVNADNTVTLLSASDFRTALSLVPGTDVQAYDQQLADIAGLTPTDNGVVIGNGANFVVESGATLKTSLGLTIGTDVQAFSSVLADLVNRWTAASASAAAALQFHEDTDNGSHKVTLIGPTSVASDKTITLPDETGTVVTTNGGATFANDISVPAEVYGSGWNGSNEVPTKNDIYDKIETISAGGLTNWTEAYNSSAPNATVPVVSFVPNTADTNNDGVFGAKGNGATLAQVPDSGTGGGNKRGQYCTDWQKNRNNANQVASGNYSTIGGGIQNRASADFSTVAGGGVNTCTGENGTIGGGISNTQSSYAGTVAGGYQNTVSANYSTIGGGRTNNINSTGDDSNNTIAGGLSNVTGATAKYAAIGGGTANQVDYIGGCVPGGIEARSFLYGQLACASGKITTAGDSQGSRLTLRKSITGQSISELFLDGSGIRAILPSGNRIWNATIKVVATVKTVGNGTVTLGDSVIGTYACGIKRLGSTTSLIGTVQDVITAQADAGMAGYVVTITADDTNEALKIEFTPPTNAGTTTVCVVTAVVDLAEVAY